VFVIVYTALCGLSARFSMRGLGDLSSGSVGVVFLTVFFWYFCASKKTYYWIVLPITILVMLYTPFGYVYGNPDFQAIISLLATNVTESEEFLSLIPTPVYVRTLFVPVVCFIAFCLARTANFRPWRNKTVNLLVIAVLVYLASPTHFIDHLYGGIEDTKKAQAELETYVSKSSWGKSETEPENKDYILVIGESARKDYFGIYGYPVEDTPFLSKAPATIVNGLTSGGNYTIGSLTNMLTLPNKEKWSPNYDLNLLDLAKSAGIKTAWLSNQGYVGVFDTPVSAIGNRADESFFTNKGDYSRLNISDFVLLTKLKEQLNKKVSGKRLIVLHTIGSHPDACRRVVDMKDQYKVTDSDFDNIACYVSTIKKTDRFLERVVDILKDKQKDSQREFSVVYFSDHGLLHNKKGSRSVRLTNTNKEQSKLHYNVPLVMIDSSSTERKELRSHKSGLNFTEGLAAWMGIRNDKLGKYDLFDGKDDPSDYGLKKKLDAILAPADPAIDISKILKK
jgi:glucan phosphoethanolaminetransferase (alkaline phosphatase superfamily)